MSRAFLPTRRLLAACVLFAACTDQPAASPPDAPQPRQAGLSAATLPQDVKVAPVDDELLRIAGSVPGFGGMYFDRAGRLTVFLTDTTQRAAVAAAIEPVLGERRRGALRDFRIQPGRYGFAELKRWSRRATPEVLAMQGVVFTDIDETRNRLVVGVESGPARTRVAAALAGLGLPREAVLVEEHAPVVQAQTLRDYRRPLVAGVQIAYGSFVCTHGPTVMPSGSNYDGFQYSAFFLTSSHCTSVQGGVENTHYYQPIGASGTHIGVEARDPAYYTGGDCPAGRRCRRSDAALVRYDTVSLWNSNYGRIAQTTFSGQLSGSITFGSPATYQDVFHMTGYQTNIYVPLPAPYVGQRLEKVGRTTGWTTGLVSQTCANTNVGGTDITLLCQVFVDAGVGGGDSGSPVFHKTQSLNGQNYAQLYGILWGSIGGTRFAFSPLANVEAELGTFNYCWCEY